MMAAAFPLVPDFGASSIEVNRAGMANPTITHHIPVVSALIETCFHYNNTKHM